VTHVFPLNSVCTAVAFYVLASLLLAYPPARLFASGPSFSFRSIQSSYNNRSGPRVGTPRLPALTNHSPSGTAL